MSTSSHLQSIELHSGSFCINTLCDKWHYCHYPRGGSYTACWTVIMTQVDLNLLMRDYTSSKAFLSFANKHIILKYQFKENYMCWIKKLKYRCSYVDTNLMKLRCSTLAIFYLFLFTKAVLSCLAHDVRIFLYLTLQTNLQFLQQMCQ